MVDLRNYIMKSMSYRTGSEPLTDIEHASVSCHYNYIANSKQDTVTMLLLLDATANDPSYSLHLALIGVYDVQIKSNMITDAVENQIVQHLYKVACDLVREAISTQHILFPDIADITPKFIKVGNINT